MRILQNPGIYAGVVLGAICVAWGQSPQLQDIALAQAVASTVELLKDIALALI